MPTSPLSQNTDIVSFDLLSNGSSIDATYQVLSFYVSRLANEIPYCEIEILDGDLSKNDFPVSDSEAFVPGAKIELKAGYDSRNKTIFKGVVVKHNLRISSEGAVLTILCQDEAERLTADRKNAYYRDMTDSAIVSKIIGDNGLTADVTATKDQLKEVVQYHTTDWDFVLSRAKTNGMLVLVQDGKISIKNPADLKDEKLELTYGMDIIEFDAEVDAQTPMKSVQVKNKNKKRPVAKFSKAALSKLDIKNISALKNTNIKGAVKFQGSALALPGTLISLKGLGKRFNGQVLVSGVVHEISNGNWTTTVEMGLSPDWFSKSSNTPNALGLLSGVQGLQTGKVIQTIDPEGAFRVYINLPQTQSQGDGIWARLSSFYASSNAGAFFYPEVGDEVVVGFLNDDPRDPIILGSMFSNAQPAPDVPDETNKTKAFVSREQMKITFDEEKKEITVTTPANNQLVLSDDAQSITMKDQNNNFIKMSPDGIELNSPTDIKITAKKSVLIDGDTGIKGSASGGNIDLSGIRISTDAKTVLDLKSSASSTLSSSGQVTVKGAMVMIN